MSAMIKEKAEDYCGLAEFEILLSNAESAADSSWEINFVSDMRSRFDQFGLRMYLSEKQYANIKRLAER